jgi:predicted secreted protein
MVKIIKHKNTKTQKHKNTKIQKHKNNIKYKRQKIIINFFSNSYYKLMKSESYCVANAVLIGIVLNIVLPLILTPFATSDERTPPSGAAALSPKGQFMHMMVHHSQVPVMSSVIIAIIVGLSVVLGYQLKPCETLMKFIK